MDNDALDSVDHFECAVVAVARWAAWPCPAAIQDGVRGGDPRGRGGVFRSHDADQDIERRPGMAAASDRISVGVLGIAGFTSGAFRDMEYIRKARRRHDPWSSRRADGAERNTAVANPSTPASRSSRAYELQ